MAVGRVLQDLAEGPGGGVDGVVDVAGDEEEDSEEDEAREGADPHAVDHDLWAFDGSVGDLFDHVRLPDEISWCGSSDELASVKRETYHGVISSQAQSTLKESKEPSDAVWPARLVNEVTEDKVSGGVVRR
ncbi:MAG: hypothetical protein Q9165_003551 [Trypethelium subeluteriae]